MYKLFIKCNGYALQTAEREGVKYRHPPLGVPHRFNFPDVLHWKVRFWSILKGSRKIFGFHEPLPSPHPPLKFENRPFFDVFWHAKHFCLQLRTWIRYQFKLNAVILRTTRPSNNIITILLWDVVFGPLGCPENEKRTIFCHISWKPHFKSMKEPSEDT